MKNKKKVISISLAAVCVIVIAAILFFNANFKDKWNSVKTNDLKDTKIYVEYANSKRIMTTLFFPKDYNMQVSGTFVLQKKEKDTYKTMKESSELPSDKDFGGFYNDSLDKNKYRNISFATLGFEFKDYYEKLEAGKYRLIFPVKANKKEYYMSIPFEITLDYEYTGEPKYKNKNVTTSVDMSLVKEYENCKKYINYSDFILGVDNQTFSRGLYNHLKEIELTTYKGKKEKITDLDKLHDTYAYFCEANMTRSDNEIYGSSFYNIVSSESTKFITMKIPEDAKKEKDKKTTVNMIFDYNGVKKRIECIVSGHFLTLTTDDFGFDNGLTPDSPTGFLLPLKNKQKSKNVYDYYVFNELEDVLNGLHKKSAVKNTESEDDDGEDDTYNDSESITLSADSIKLDKKIYKSINDASVKQAEWLEENKDLLRKYLQESNADNFDGFESGEKFYIYKFPIKVWNNSHGAVDESECSFLMFDKNKQDFYIITTSLDDNGNINIEDGQGYKSFDGEFIKQHKNTKYLYVKADMYHECLVDKDNNIHQESGNIKISGDFAGEFDFNKMGFSYNEVTKTSDCAEITIK